MLGEAKPHVHVYKGSKEVGVESVDQKESHKKTLKNVPNSVKKKVRALNDCKKGQKDLKNMQKAKSQIKAKKLNLKKQ